MAPSNRRLHQRASALAAAGTERSGDLQTAAGAKVGAVTGSALTLVTMALLYLMVFCPGS